MLRPSVRLGNQSLARRFMATISGNPGQSLAPPRAAAVAGVIFSVLMGTSLILIRLSVPPSHGDPGAWMIDPARYGAVRLAVHLIPFAGIAFLWFIGVVRSRLGALEDQFFATVFLGSGLLFLASLFASAAFSGAMIETIREGRIHVGDSDAYQLIRQVVGAFLNVFAIKMAGVFTISTSMIVLRTAILPRWVAFCGFGCAVVLLLTITRWQWIALLFPAWMLVISSHIVWSDLLSPGRHSAP
jgi:hypothetical protein